MLVHVMLYDSGQDGEGIHSLELSGKTVVLMFENKDDAERYSGLLEAQDFPIPKVEKIERDEIETFCEEAGYEAKFVESGFVPSSEEDRLLLAPPERNKEVLDWENDLFEEQSDPVTEDIPSNEITEIRKRLEDLL